ncbi:MAG: AraC family transcriptional regulator [Tepidanaerobacteraceae bacterium]|jgi:AraC-like DNA-binding protein|nr:AraC family transcriptional regulator [Tepidanaerobacteraceae bacterium]
MTEQSRNKPFFDIYSRLRENSDDLSPHMHYHHQIIFITEGLVQFIISGRHYLAGPNSLLLISNLESHAVKVLQYPYDRYVLAINSEFAATFLRHPLLVSVFLRRPDNFSNLIELDEKTAENVRKACIEMTEELKQRKIMWEETVASMVMQLLISVYRYNSEPFWPADASNASSLVFNVQNYISLNYQKKLSLEDLSNKFFVNKFYLSHIFKSVTGFNYKDYLIRYRLSIAKDFLANTKMPVTEICSACGYNNINHFNRIFKKYEGIAPTEYRKNVILMDKI